MLGTFLLPFRHLSLDHARIDPIAARVGPLPLHLPEQGLIPCLEGCGRRAVAFRHAAFQNLETPGERQSVRIEVHRRGGLEPQRPAHEMAQRQRVDLLDHTRRCLAPQLRRLGRTTRVLVRLLLVEDLFRLPAIMPPKRGTYIGPPRAATSPPAEGRCCSSLTGCRRLWA